MKLPYSIVAAMAALAIATGCTPNQHNNAGTAPLKPSASVAANATIKVPSQEPSLAPSQSASPSTTLPASATTPLATPTPTKPLLKRGSKGSDVEQLQTWLYQSARRAFYDNTCSFDQDFGPYTQEALVAWQKAAGHPPTGTIRIDSPEWNQLQREATAQRLPAGISATAVKAATSGNWAIDASKSPSCVRILQHDANAPHGVKVVINIAASYAGWAHDEHGVLKYYTTPNGVFKLYYPDPLGPKAYSRKYHAPMPWAMYFNGDDAFHYDGLFPSHGCVHIPSMSVAKFIWHMDRGTTVVVHG